jgi:hypothetical protein
MNNLPIFLCVLLLSSLYLSPLVTAQRYAAIFNFGDSLVDAGNLCVDGIPAYLATARLPYGMNFFGYPTGRCSDGRLVIDYIGMDINTYFVLRFSCTVCHDHLMQSFPEYTSMYGERKMIRIYAIELAQFLIINCQSKTSIS